MIVSILTTDPPTSYFENFEIRMAMSPQRVIRSTSCLVLGWGFQGQQIEWRYFRLDQIQDGEHEIGARLISKVSVAYPRYEEAGNKRAGLN